MPNYPLDIKWSTHDVYLHLGPVGKPVRGYRLEELLGARVDSILGVRARTSLEARKTGLSYIGHLRDLGYLSGRMAKESGVIGVKCASPPKWSFCYIVQRYGKWDVELWEYLKKTFRIMKAWNRAKRSGMTLKEVEREQNISFLGYDPEGG